MNMHGQSEQRYWLKKVVLLRKHGAEPNVEGQLRDPQARDHSQAKSHWEVSMLECPFRLVGREKSWFSATGRICSYWNSTCPRLLTVIYGFPANQSPFVQMHFQTGWEFENTSSSAVSFCPETGQLQLLKWTSALATRTKICSTTPWRPGKNPKARQMVLIGLCFSWSPRCAGEQGQRNREHAADTQLSKLENVLNAQERLNLVQDKECYVVANGKSIVGKVAVWRSPVILPTDLEV